ncbi:hypothetical protein ABE096_05570 [Robertmurraya massiliosenegalensis]|uniref:hypothetical protein n=1 Tax=Robertmurraya massiliosenegalensis TaxID=1287657 RepID=UPI003D2B66CF
MLSCSPIYAHTDSGERLHNVYQKLFHTRQEKVANIVSDKIDSYKESAIEQIGTLFKETEAALTHFLFISSTNAQKDIEDYKESHHTQLLKTKDQLLKQDFQEFSQEKSKEIDVEISQDIEGFLEEILSN